MVVVYGPWGSPGVPLGLPRTQVKCRLGEEAEESFFHLISGARRESTACAVLEWEVSGHRLGWQVVPEEQFTHYIVDLRALPSWTLSWVSLSSMGDPNSSTQLAL